MGGRKSKERAEGKQANANPGQSKGGLNLKPPRSKKSPILPHIGRKGAVDAKGKETHPKPPYLQNPHQLPDFTKNLKLVQRSNEITTAEKIFPQDEQEEEIEELFNSSPPYSQEMMTPRPTEIEGYAEEEGSFHYDEGCCRGSLGPIPGQPGHCRFLQQAEEYEGLSGESSPIINSCALAGQTEPNRHITNYCHDLYQANSYYHVYNGVSDRNKVVLGTYTKIFDTQVDDSHNHEVIRMNVSSLGLNVFDRSYQNSKEDGRVLWNSIFVFRVFASLSAINFLQACIVHNPSIRRTTLTTIPASKRVGFIVILTALNMVLAVVSVLNHWGGRFPTDICTLLLFLIFWTIIWSNLGCLFHHIAHRILVSIAIDCLFMAVATLIHSTFNPRSFKIYTFAVAAIFVGLLINLFLTNLGYMGSGTWDWETFYIIFVSTLFASMIFSYIIIDITAILNGSRPIAWPQQWIFGVLSIYQDWVWMIGEGFQILLYCLPCTYCKQSKHTVFRRWKFWNYNHHYLAVR